MSERQFGVGWIQRADHGPRQSAAEIVCGRCGQKDHVVNTTNNRHLPPTMVTKKFQQAGWVVGGGPAADRCPTCAALIRMPVPKLRIVEKEQPMSAAKPVEARAPDVPADVKRRINAKIFEVYEGPETGYAAGWSDQRISTELNVPRAAVAEIRDQFHGPAKDNADIREMLQKAEVIFAEVASLEKRLAADATEMRALSDRVAELKKCADAIRKAVAA